MNEVSFKEVEIVKRSETLSGLKAGPVSEKRAEVSGGTFRVENEVSLDVPTGRPMLLDCALGRLYAKQYRG